MWKKPGELGGFGMGSRTIMKGLILAQNERWRRGLGMQVERELFCGDFGQSNSGTAANGVVRRRLRTPRTGIATGNCE